jgi:hypothetical protein
MGASVVPSSAGAGYLFEPLIRLAKFRVTIHRLMGVPVDSAKIYR